MADAYFFGRLPNFRAKATAGRYNRSSPVAGNRCKYPRYAHLSGKFCSACSSGRRQSELARFMLLEERADADPFSVLEADI
ncbi:MAG: hypothetical protein DIU65_00635 [Proteobacteria bacterium]|jgi:hypothetical protein|nr:MAG: hypothetical protein DIU65_00635 [Pseudomonadota bacterium]